MIPKIIHQTGPADKNIWHPLWTLCHQSWLEHFNDFTHTFWTDEDLDNLVQQSYPTYYSLYQSFPLHIMRIDFARFCILHRFGGIYADLDMFCYKPFFSELNQGVHLIENPCGNDIFENSLMCSDAGNSFWLECMEQSLKRFNYIKEKFPRYIQDAAVINSTFLTSKLRPTIVFYLSGTNLLSNVATNTITPIYILPGCVYNNNIISYDPEFRTKHLHTGIWGKEDIELVKDYKQHYLTTKNIDLNNYDIFTDYTHGNYVKIFEPNLNKNSVDHVFNDTITSFKYQ